MLHCIKIFTNACEVMMQVKRVIGKAILHKLPIYNEYMCLCWVSTLSRMICCLFSNCNKSFTTRLRSLHIRFNCVVNVPRSYVPVLPAKQWGIAFEICLLLGQRKHWKIVSGLRRLTSVQMKSHVFFEREIKKIFKKKLV